MPVFKLFYKILYKNKSSILIYMVIFVFMSTFLVSSNKSTSQGFQEVHLNMGVVNQDGSQLSRELLAYLEKTNVIKELPDDREKLQDALYYRNVEYILRIPKGFEESFLDGKEVRLENIKVPDSSTGYLLDNKINEFLKNTSIYMKGGESLSQAASKASDLSQSEIQVHSLSGEKIQAQQPNIAYYLKFLPYILLSILITGFAPAFLTLYQEDNRRRIICSSTSLRSYNQQLTVGLILFSVAAWLLLLVLGGLLYGDEMDLVPMGYMLANTFVFTLVSMAVGYFIGFVAKSENAVSGLSVVTGLGMAFLGGIFVPLDFINEKALIFSRLLPTYWYVKVNDIMFGSEPITGGRLTEIWQSMGIQLLFAAAVFTVGLLMSRRQREEE